MARRGKRIDPTANVLDKVRDASRRTDDLLAANIKRIDDLRDLTTTWRDKFELLQVSHQQELARAEQGRIDALLLQNTNNVALALSKQSDQASAQDKRIATLEQNQYSGAGGTAATDKAAGRAAISTSQLLQLAAVVAAVAGTVVLITQHLR